MKRFFYCVALAMAFSGCTKPGVWTPDAKSFVDGLWDAAKMLCLLANAEKAGTTMDKVQDCCEKREQIEPWLDAAKIGVLAGATKTGMPEPLAPGADGRPRDIGPRPLTPANAFPQSVRERQEESQRSIKAVPELEERK